MEAYLNERAKMCNEDVITYHIIILNYYECNVMETKPPHSVPESSG